MHNGVVLLVFLFFPVSPRSYRFIAVTSLHLICTITMERNDRVAYWLLYEYILLYDFGFGTRTEMALFPRRPTKRKSRKSRAVNYECPTSRLFIKLTRQLSRQFLHEAAKWSGETTEGGKRRP